MSKKSKNIFLLLLMPVNILSMYESAAIAIKKQLPEKIKALEKKEEKYLLIKQRWLNHPLREQISWDKQLYTGWPHDPLKQVTTSGEYHAYYFHRNKQKPELIAHFDPLEEEVTTYVTSSKKITISYDEFLHIFRKQ
ncbi:MAG: hypothetical protein WC707_02190 [Candidatus Babeliaceae bacterium]|jgi:hypothetical protein